MKYIVKTLINIRGIEVWLYSIFLNAVRYSLQHDQITNCMFIANRSHVSFLLQSLWMSTCLPVNTVRRVLNQWICRQDLSFYLSIWDLWPDSYLIEWGDDTYGLSLVNCRQNPTWGRAELADSTERRNIKFSFLLNQNLSKFNFSIRQLSCPLQSPISSNAPARK